MEWVTDVLRRIRQPRMTNREVEARALYYMLAAFSLSFVVSLIIFTGWGNVAIFGRHSLGLIAVVLACVAAFGGYFYVAYHSRRHETGQLSKWGYVRLVATTVALAFVHAAIIFLMATVLFFVLDSAFTGLLMNPYAASTLVAATAGLAAYGTYIIASKISTLTISTALAIFLVVGALTSMITAGDQYWWQYHLSYLGGGYSFSAYAFEVTLAIGGLVLICVADFIASDFAKLKKLAGGNVENKANVIRVLLILIGVFLALVGLFRWNIHPLIHNAAASGMVVLFLVLIIGLPYFVPSFPRAFFIFSYAMMGAILLCAYLYFGIAYFNLTAFEILAFVIVFGWLVVFIRQVAAALKDKSPLSQLKQKVAPKA